MTAPLHPDIVRAVDGIGDLIGLQRLLSRIEPREHLMEAILSLHCCGALTHGETALLFGANGLEARLK